MTIAEEYRTLQEEISRSCRRAGRDPSEITLIAVTKTVPAERIREAWECGVRDIGENRVQEMAAKQPLLQDLAFRWHLIGHLQTNKVKAALPGVEMIHSVDRIGLIEEIDRRTDRIVPVLLQVNVAREASKFGADPEDAPALVDAIEGRPRLALRGFMTIAPLEGGEAAAREAFAGLRKLRDALAKTHPSLDLSILSMGMSGDWPIAIEEGATHLRIGSRIFGARS
jgi:pyridoxal phosphate enzyme (YggS family)